jgi:hypothetical protein
MGFPASRYHRKMDRDPDNSPPVGEITAQKMGLLARLISHILKGTEAGM